MELRQEKGGVRALQTRFDEAERIAGQMLADARAFGDLYTEAHGRTLLAFTYLQSYQPIRAFDQAQQAFVLWRRLGNDKGQARALHYMGEACRLSRRPRQARHYLEITRARLARLAEEPWRGHLDQSLGALALEEGDAETALAHLQEALTRFKSIGDERSRTASLHAVGIALTHQGRYAEAERALREALAGWMRLGVTLETANVHYALGCLYRRTGQPDEARQSLQQARQIALELSPGAHRDRLLDDIQAELDAL